MALYASPFKVTHVTSGTVLVTYDDNLTTWPAIDGGQATRLVNRVTAAGRKGFSDGNEFNSYSLAWMRQYETPDAAGRACFGFPSATPRTRSIIRFANEAGDSYDLDDAIITGWSARPEGSNVYFSLRIEGGVLAIT